MKDEVNFLPESKHQGFSQRHAQSNLNKNFVISLRYLKKKVRDYVNCLHTDKHQNFLQVDAIVFGRRGPACPRYPK